MGFGGSNRRVGRGRRSGQDAPSAGDSGGGFAHRAFGQVALHRGGPEDALPAQAIRQAVHEAGEAGIGGWFAEMGDDLAGIERLGEGGG